MIGIDYAWIESRRKSPDELRSSKRLADTVAQPAR
jgi:hypothetical protein